MMMVASCLISRYLLASAVALENATWQFDVIPQSNRSNLISSHDLDLSAGKVGPPIFGITRGLASEILLALDNVETGGEIVSLT